MNFEGLFSGSHQQHIVHLQSSEELENFHHDKKKHIRKLNQKTKNFKQYSSVQQEKVIHSKVSAKEAKRLRQQNRRANHKQYVSNLQAKLQQKEKEVDQLQQKISELTEKLKNISYPKYCSKCNIALNQSSAAEVQSQTVNKAGQNLRLDENFISEMQIEFQVAEKQEFFDEQFIERVRNDEGSLRINFGNNFLFILITFCCLSAGCIADNAQLAMQPIYPFRLKSEMCYLPNPKNLDKVKIYTPLEKFLNIPGYQLFRKQCGPLLLDEEITTVHKYLDFDWNWLQIPELGEIGNWSNKFQISFSSLSSNFIVRNFLNGYNYYV